MRRAALAIAAAITVGLTVGSSASASAPVVTSQAQAANAAFLAYAPPPAGGPGALCLVDTGVSGNADTIPGLVSATALEGGGTGADVDPQGHGTTMAMIAGAAGVGMVGAWPQLKLVSVRATSAPAPGQEPTFEFNDYWEGIQQCLEQDGHHIDAIDLSLSSTVPPSPDEAEKLHTAVAEASASNIAIVGAAGNTPGAVQEPAAQPGILAVGAFTAQPDQTSATAIGATCSFSANEGLTFFAPGCGLDQAEPFTDKPICCGNGTSQAAAFTAAVLVALMSYDPPLSYSAAEQLLVSTATDGDLNVAAAFEAAGLSSIVEAGNRNIPKTGIDEHKTSGGSLGKVVLRRLRWKRGVLTIRVASVPRGDRLRVRLLFAHRRRLLSSRDAMLRFRSPRPRQLQLWLVRGSLKGPVLHVGMGR
jgi:hypothetical protein